MKRIDKTVERFRADDGCEMMVAFTNRGDPYREGIQVSLGTPSGHYGGHFFMEDHEARRLRDLLNRIYPMGLTP